MKIPSDGFKHYDYILIYSGEVLAISDEPTKFLQKIDSYFGLNPGSLSKLIVYLSAKVKPMSMYNGSVAVSLSPLQYI